MMGLSRKSAITYMISWTLEGETCVHICVIIVLNGLMCHPCGVVAIDTDCCAVGPGFESQRRHGLDVCKCIVHSRHGSTPNSRLAASPLLMLVKSEERWEAPGGSQGIHSQNWLVVIEN
ncbi:hypothetical protein TNCV_2958821 [Trichonephila clavipes]|nr:hypothetical protein TNCV_2958821 [Trichonephila clavipes]